jgi:hypothetical protein
MLSNQLMTLHSSSPVSRERERECIYTKHDECMYTEHDDGLQNSEKNTVRNQTSSMIALTPSCWTLTTTSLPSCIVARCTCAIFFFSFNNQKTLVHFVKV